MPLHPKAKLFVSQLAEQDRPGWEDVPIEESRRLFASLKGTFGVGPEMAEVNNMELNGIPVRIFRPAAGERLPVVMFFHGGGFVIGDLDTHDSTCRRLSEASGHVVISVDYRRAPEHRFPAALDDCYAATCSVAERADELNVDANRMLTAGDSAGGNLATTVCLKVRNEGGPKVRGQVLIYPVVEPNYETESYQAFGTGHGLTLETMKWFWNQYIEGIDNSNSDRAYAIPSLADVTGLPPAHVVLAEYDVLRDEGYAYADQLKAAGVPTTTQQYDGMLHGFVHFAGFFETGVEASRDIGIVMQEMVS